MAAAAPAEKMKSVREQEIYSRKMAAHYSAQIVAIDELLQAGEAKKAFRKSNLRYKELIDRIVSGPMVDDYLGRTLGLRAIADCQLGRRDSGLWDWHVAVQLLPALERVHLEVYGEAGIYLRDHPVRKTDAEHKSWADCIEAPADCSEAPAGDWVAPRRKRGRDPVFPQARRGLEELVEVTVEIVIDTDGRPYDPVIIETAGELTLVAITLETMKSWIFEPARLDGEPTPVAYVLTVGYRWI